MNNVFVYIETEGGKVADVSLELLTKGRELADRLGCKLEALALGHELKEMDKIVGRYGADTLWLADDAELAPYRTLPHTAVVCGIFEEEKPQIALFGATPVGRDLAPRVSSTLRSGLTADCTSLVIGDHTDAKSGRSYENLLYQIRPAFGGNIIATIACLQHRPQMATVRPGVMQALAADDSRTGEIIRMEVNPTNNLEVLETVKSTKTSKDITEAKILVSAGRGIGSAEKVSMVQDLADALGGDISGSRAVVDAGWMEKDRQVGQTGKTVRPELYVACGISGAIQHAAGMEGSEYIVAINKEETAPIFDIADLGIIGDVNAILPKLTEAIKKYKAAQAGK